MAAQAFEVEGQRYRNIEVSFGPEHGRPVIVGAHYDVEENTLGADDNASGVVGLLELARALGRNPRGFLYVLWPSPWKSLPISVQMQWAAAVTWPNSGEGVWNLGWFWFSR